MVTLSSNIVQLLCNYNVIGRDGFRSSLACPAVVACELLGRLISSSSAPSLLPPPSLPPPLRMHVALFPQSAAILSGGDCGVCVDIPGDGMSRRDGTTVAALEVCRSALSAWRGSVHDACRRLLG